MKQETTYEKARRCAAAIRQKTDFVPKAALILVRGSADLPTALKKLP